MTQTRDNVQRVAEFNTLFLSLNDKGQETALTVLQALEFAQTVQKGRNKYKVIQGGQTNEM